MSLNQPAPPRGHPSMAAKAKQTIASASEKLAAVKDVLGEKSHHLLPAAVATFALGDRKKVRPAYESEKPWPLPPRFQRYDTAPPADATGIVTPDVTRSVTPSDEYDDSESSWEEIISDSLYLSPATKMRQADERKRPRARKGQSKEVNRALRRTDRCFRPTCPSTAPSEQARDVTRQGWPELTNYPMAGRRHEQRHTREPDEEEDNDDDDELLSEPFAHVRPERLDACGSSSEEFYDSISSDEFVKQVLGGGQGGTASGSGKHQSAGSTKKGVQMRWGKLQHEGGGRNQGNSNVLLGGDGLMQSSTFRPPENYFNRDSNTPDATVQGSAGTPRWSQQVGPKSDAGEYDRSRLSSWKQLGERRGTLGNVSTTGEHCANTAGTPRRNPLGNLQKGRHPDLKVSDQPGKVMKTAGGLGNTGPRRTSGSATSMGKYFKSGSIVGASSAESSREDWKKSLNLRS